MGRKNVVLSYQMIEDGDMSADVLQAIASNVINQDLASVYVSWSGTAPVGEMTVEAQNGDSEPWYTLDFNSTLTVTGNTGDLQIVFEQMPFTSIRLRYNRTSGTGLLNAVFSSKTVGA